MSIRGALFLAVFVTIANPVIAQDAQPYIVGEAGGSFGDGSAAPALAIGFGYRTAHNFGFEIEASVVPDLNFGDPGIPRIAIYPPVTIESTGRIVALQTHVVGVLPNGGSKLRAFLLAGGGIADVERRIRIEVPPFTPVFPGIPERPDLPPGFVIPDLPGIFGGFQSDRRASETSLVLSGGAGFEYALTPHFGLGMSVRYQHVFSDPEALDIARLGARVTWTF